MQFFVVDFMWCLVDKTLSWGEELGDILYSLCQEIFNGCYISQLECPASFKRTPPVVIEVYPSFLMFQNDRVIACKQLPGGYTT